MRRDGYPVGAARSGDRVTVDLAGETFTASVHAARTYRGLRISPEACDLAWRRRKFDPRWWCCVDIVGLGLRIVPHDRVKPAPLSDAELLARPPAVTNAEWETCRRTALAAIGR